MRRAGLAAIILTIALVAGSVSVAFAETLPSDEPVHISDPDELQPTDIDVVLPTASAEEPAYDPSAAEEAPSEEPSAEPTADEPVEEMPQETSEPAPGPTEPAPSAAPAPTEEPSSAQDVPVLEIAAGQTIYLHQETPSIKVRWKHGVPSSIAGYVWSYSVPGGTDQVFYVTYDPSSTVLAAGALNGHINAPGTYEVRCQPVDSAQEPAASAASVTLFVEQSSTELSISANRSFPVPVGSELVLTAHVGQQNSDILRYEWKPAGSSSADRSCTISSVAAGPVRYTCTAVLRSGQRITGTLVVTGTELIAANRSVTLSKDTSALTAVWSNGTPEGSIRYGWSVRGESGTDLTQRGRISLPATYLSGLRARENPYTVSCQAYKGNAPIALPATFQVRVTDDGALAGTAVRSDKHIMGDENGLVPDTDDISALSFWIAWFAAASLFAACVASGRQRS